MNSRIPHRSRNARQSHQKRNRKRRNWFLFILKCAVLALCAELVFVVLTSPKLRINKIDIRGAKTIPLSDLRARTKCAVGSNFFLVDKGRVRKNVLKNPVVRDVRVSRRPMRKLVVQVEERIPRIALSAAGKMYLVDGSGFVFKQVRRSPKRLAVLEIPNLKGSPCIGSKPYHKHIMSSLKCFRKASEKGFRIEKISVDPGNNMCLNMVSGLCVKLGPPDDLGRKFANLKTVLAARQPEIATDALYVDLSCITAPAWKPKNASVTY
ncbi:MAG: FtsQ-type POTRA domain-containing protein [Armatimonadota bacterium]|nr:FtsQ-type POTRA domain-containing protein [Armatimonadota bacterium]